VLLDQNIPVETQHLERFYESLDELDQYELPEFGTSNFYIEEMKNHNLYLKEARKGLRTSYLDKNNFLIVNPKMNEEEK
jgi:hypothetical protein